MCIKCLVWCVACGTSIDSSDFYYFINANSLRSFFAWPWDDRVTVLSTAFCFVLFETKYHSVTQLECCDAISAHNNLHLLGSSNSPVSAS